MLLAAVLLFEHRTTYAAEEPCIKKTVEVNLGKSVPFLELIAKMADPFVDNCIGQKVELKTEKNPSVLAYIELLKSEREAKIANKEFCAAASLTMQLAQISPQDFVSVGGVDGIEALVEQARINQKDLPSDKPTAPMLISSKLKFLRNWIVQSPDDKSDCMGLSSSVPECDEGTSAVRALAAYRRYFPKTETGEFMSVEAYRIQTLRDWARLVPADTSTCIRPSITAPASECDEGQKAIRALTEYRKLYPEKAAQKEFLTLEKKLIDYKSGHETTKLNLFTSQYDVAVHPSTIQQKKLSKARGDEDRTDGMVHANCVGPSMDSSGQITNPGKCDLVHKTSLAVRAINQARDMLAWSRPEESIKIKKEAAKYLTELDQVLKEHPEWKKYVEQNYQNEKWRAEFLKALGK
jgi:hypothetical protein